MAQPTVGMVGAGQLARMTYEASTALDVRLRVLAADPNDSAAQICRDVTTGSLDDVLVAFATECDIVTFDHELVDQRLLAAAADAGAVLRPSPEALRFAQDKAYQRERFAQAGLPVPTHALVADAEDAAEFGARHGWPLLLKSPLGGYDGRGVETVEDRHGISAAWERLGAGPLLAEERVPLAAELAVVMARRPSGDTAAYPLIETVQRDGICTELRVPAAVPDPVAASALELAAAVAEVVEAAGILAVELFWDGDDLLVNEVATRPHNSGHWSIDGAVTSQFANHLRGVLDWPLGTVAASAPAVVTVNVLGPTDGSDPRDRRSAALAVPGVAVHLYGKGPRPGRKLGHVTAVGDEPAETRERARRCAALLEGASVDDRVA